MKVDDLSLERIAHLRHELLTPINHILGFTEIQMEEAEETGLIDCIPAFAEIHSGGRALQAIVEDELASISPRFDPGRLDARLGLEAGPTLGLAKRLADQLRARERHAAAEQVDLVSGALRSLLVICRELRK